MKAIKVALTFLLFGFTATAIGQTYTVIDLGVLPGDSASSGIGINSSGQIAGCSDETTTYFPCNGTEPGHAFIWDRETGMQDLGTLSGDEYSSANVINDAGEVAGISQEALGVYHAFSWTAKTGIIALPALPGGSNTFASGLNAAGLIVGSSDFKGSNGNEHAVLWTPAGKIYDLGTLQGAQFAEAVGINSHNLVTGTASFNTTTTAFIWTKKDGIEALPSLVPGGGTSSSTLNDQDTVVGNAVASSGSIHPVLWTTAGIRDLGTLPGGFGTAFGVNNFNQVVGYSRTASGDAHAFIWSPKNGIHDLNNLIPLNSGWVLVWGAAINDAGEITGWGTINGENHAYLLAP